MKLNSLGISNNNYNNTDKNNIKNQSNPNFKGLLDVPGQIMNGLEKGGFAASFIVQDTLGMTLPRTGEGLQRGIDKDRVKATWNVIKAKLLFRKPSEEDKKKCLKLKDLNFKEGLEVGIREGLSGPLMMFTPILILALGKKYIGKSSYTNSSMISRLGKQFKTVAKEGAKDSIGAIKKNFYKANVAEVVKATTKAADKVAETAFIDKAVSSLEMLDKYSEKIAKATGKRKSLYKKAQKRAASKLADAFNSFHKTNSSDLNLMNRLKFDGQVYETDKFIDGLRGYAEDALKGKKVSDITEKYADKVMKSSLTKRFVTNIAAALGTIGSLSIVPALYKLVNPVPPGALGDPTKAGNNAAQVNTSKQQNKNGQVSFTGKWDKLARNFEFNGGQFTPALMTALAVGGLMGPRVGTAAKRAPENPVTHKKDYSEIPEILTRDIVSTAAVTFGVPMLSKGLISLYENKSGFVLKNKATKPMSTVKKVLDYLNPFSSLSYYGIKDLDQIYGNINSTKKLGNMAKFVDGNGGSIAKVLKTVKKSAKVFEEFGLDINALAKQGDRKAANGVILEKMKNSEFAQKMVEALKPAKKGGANNMLKRARTLNSIVSCAATIIFVPAFLGIVLPKVVYKMTENRQKKNALANAQALAQAPAGSNGTTIDYSKLKTANNSTFNKMKHS